MNSFPLFAVITLFPAWCFCQENKPAPDYKGSFREKQTIIGQKLISQKNDPIDVSRKGNTLNISGVPMFDFSIMGDSLPGLKNDSVSIATNGWTVYLGKDSCIFSSPGADTVYKWTQPLNNDIRQPDYILKDYHPTMEQKSERRYYGDLLIVEIPPDFPDKMPIYKPDNSVHYYLRIAGKDQTKKKN